MEAAIKEAETACADGSTQACAAAWDAVSAARGSALEASDEPYFQIIIQALYPIDSLHLPTLALSFQPKATLCVGLHMCAMCGAARVLELRPSCNCVPANKFQGTAAIMCSS